MKYPIIPIEGLRLPTTVNALIYPLISLLEKTVTISEKQGGEYTHFDVTIEKGAITKVNLYTPLLTHNDFKTCEEMERFMDDVIKVGQGSLREKKLKQALAIARSEIDRITDNIKDLEAELAVETQPQSTDQ